MKQSRGAHATVDTSGSYIADKIYQTILKTLQILGVNVQWNCDFTVTL